MAVHFAKMHFVAALENLDRLERLEGFGGLGGPLKELGGTETGKASWKSCGRESSGLRSVGLRYCLDCNVFV